MKFKYGLLLPIYCLILITGQPAWSAQRSLFYPKPTYIGFTIPPHFCTYIDTIRVEKKQIDPRDWTDIYNDNKVAYRKIAEEAQNIGANYVWTESPSKIDNPDYLFIPLTGLAYFCPFTNDMNLFNNLNEEINP